MSFLSEVKRAARDVRDEADTQMQLAKKYAEQVNLQRASKDALAEAGREVLRDWDGGDTVQLSPRARSLFKEGQRIDGDLKQVKDHIRGLREGRAGEAATSEEVAPPPGGRTVEEGGPMDDGPAERSR